VDDEPALRVSYSLTHPPRGWGIVAERRTETAGRVARYKTDYCSRENLAMLPVPQTAAATWRVLCASVSLFFSIGFSSYIVYM